MTGARHADPADVDTPLAVVDLPPHVQQLADLFLNAWCTVAGPYWHEAGAMVAINTPGPIRDGLRALTVLELLRELHKPRSWADSSDVTVCTCGSGAYEACPTAQLLAEP